MCPVLHNTTEDRCFSTPTFSQTLELPLKDLLCQLETLQKQYGFAIDARLYYFALGLSIGSGNWIKFWRGTRSQLCACVEIFPLTHVVRGGEWNLRPSSLQLRVEAVLWFKGIRKLFLSRFIISDGAQVGQEKSVHAERRGDQRVHGSPTQIHPRTVSEQYVRLWWKLVRCYTSLDRVLTVGKSELYLKLISLLLCGLCNDYDFSGHWSVH